MSTCAACGHQPVAGPFCTNCGSATAPAAPPSAPPAPSPPAPPPEAAPPPAAATPATPSPGSSPPPARFPLFADEAEADGPPPPRFPLYADEAAPTATRSTAVGTPPPPPPAPPPADHPQRHAARWLPWLLGVLFVALIATVGVVLLAGSDDGPGTASDDTTSGSGDDGESGGGSDLTGLAEPTVPKPARASTDNQGNRTTYVAANLSDGEATTCWRTAGDATGKVLVFRFDEPVTITEVGMINGYAKTDPPNDWYAANRRVLEAEWSFDSGDPVSQTLEESRDLQTVAVDAVETREVRLRLVQVSPPGGRNYTAISEISLRGE